MKEIRREHYKGNTIPKYNQENLDPYDVFCAYLRNYACTSGWEFIAIGSEISVVVCAWNNYIGYEKARKKELVISEIMETQESFQAFKKWFHNEYMKKAENHA